MSFVSVVGGARKSFSWVEFIIKAKGGKRKAVPRRDRRHGSAEPDQAALDISVR